MIKNFGGQKTMKFSVVENGVIKPEQIIQIYAANGWGDENSYKNKDIESMFKSLGYYNLCVNESEHIVGFLKSFSDTYSTQLFEILVHPDFQKKGCGRMMMRKFIKMHSNTAIFVVGVNDTFGFFEKFGFNMKSSLYACSKKSIQ